MLVLPEDLQTAILAAPDSDSPRLVAADWLEEQGETDRAAFIRVQCELAEMRQKRIRNERRRVELTQQETELLLAHQLTWVGPLAPVVRDRQLQVHFHRGMIREILTDHALPEAALAQFAIEPFIERLRLRWQSGTPRTILEQVAKLSNLRTIELWFPGQQLRTADLQPIIVLTRVKQLRIRGGRWGGSLLTSLRGWLKRAWAQQSEKLPDDDQQTAYRAKLGKMLTSTTTGLDIVTIINPPRSALQFAANLPGLRRIEIHRQTNSRIVGLRSCDTVRSLSLEDVSGWVPNALQELPELEDFTIHARFPINDALLPRQPLPRLRSLGIRGTLVPANQQFGIVGNLPELRVLHWNLANPTTLEHWKLQPRPKVRELAFGKLPTGITPEWIRSQFPHLHSLLLKGSDENRLDWEQMLPDCAINGRIPESQWQPVPNLPDGMTMQMPRWMAAHGAVAAPHADQVSEIQPLGAWTEFAEDATAEFPQMCWLGGIRIWLERLERPAGAVRSREWLTGPTTGLVRVDWSNFHAVESPQKTTLRVLSWNHGWLSGTRAVWITPTHLVRLLAEHPEQRSQLALPLIRAVIRSLRFPALESPKRTRRSPK
ncbi:TIGR02996 domain-containing protein [Tuwongella immobilis]|uniref:Repeat-companion domain TIGR02996 n=1 Tax=Tuwongella immobilis TaxID=692036 RepID=A0A6C2YJJ8_9BACT|nr:TIGR02996 domain-containing protein [Tuwongella immobilis]VIP01409.1 Repeat-companion domain TIGR02996 OS=Singulisphaera acidiphila (strain ATCC BAA-1392 / DSM 18658 / VKM B-2454 / MOB10) GN=Sinac_4455 PE=4 SV=1 [Tuwongella immobilis]VTR98319.1 Repeat-companion domain TIGR02996 OS=Singulisphaera acidiphila (strain ATCC BAA-1392 / DSM 18658 / VKM B-2454 / MOB10) GN=Sinac_4455 PE=4 SV=1 [Tuwongella immobilis]